MILDQNTLLSDNQAISASAPSENVIDFGPIGKTSYGGVQLRRRIGQATAIPLLIQVTEDFATLTSLTVSFQSDDDPTFATPKTIAGVTVGVAQLAAGYILPMDKFPRDVSERYVRLLYTVTGANATAGRITAGITTAVDAGYKG